MWVGLGFLTAWWLQGSWTAYVVGEGTSMRVWASKKEGEMPLGIYPHNLYSMVPPIFSWFREPLYIQGEITFHLLKEKGKGIKSQFYFVYLWLVQKAFAFGMQKYRDGEPVGKKKARTLWEASPLCCLEIKVRDNYFFCSKIYTM